MLQTLKKEMRETDRRIFIMHTTVGFLLFGVITKYRTMKTIRISFYSFLFFVIESYGNLHK